jgi:tetratricopeptide (TPR) repeat protein
MVFFRRAAIFPWAPGVLVMVLWSGLVSAQSPASEADSLYANRADLASAKKAAELWQAALSREPGNFEAAWKLARACYWLGGHARESERRAFLEQGINAARSASQIEPGRPEGHFWTAANMGALAESGGMRAGLKYRKPIKAELETVLRIDPAFQQGSADRALGRWYFKVPGLFGGSKKQAEEHLRTSLKYNQESTATHFFLAELFLDQDRKEEARQELTKVLEAPLDPNWTPEDHDFKSKAKSMLARLND